MRLVVRTAIHVLAFCLGSVFLSAAESKPLAITQAQVYISPTIAPLTAATILMRDGRIVAVGNHVQVPSEAEVIRCNGCTVTAGFWNCHVHFTEPKWENAATQPAPKLAKQLESMLTRSGFTTFEALQRR